MFTQKNALISLAVAAVLAGCGGGGDDGVTPATGTQNQAQNQQQNQNQNQNQNQTVAPTSDTKLAGNVALASDLVVGTQGGKNLAIGYTDFTSQTPRPANAEFGANTYGAFGFDHGTNAPIKAFGYRVKYVPPAAGPAADSKVGRIVFQLQDQSTVTPKEVLQIMVDKITLAVSDTGVLSVTQAADSKVYVYVKNAAGQEGFASATAPAGVVSLTPVTDAGADPTSGDLMLNVDAAVGAAKAAATGTNAAALATAADLSSTEAVPFEASLTISNANMVRESNGAALAGTPISITNSNIAGVASGGGVAKGYIQVPAQ